MWGQFEDIEGDAPKQPKPKPKYGSSTSTTTTAPEHIANGSVSSAKAGAKPDSDGRAGLDLDLGLDLQPKDDASEPRVVNSSATVNKQLLKVLSSSSLEFSPRYVGFESL